MRERIKILGVYVDKVDFAEAIDRFKQFLECGECNIICTPNPEMIYAAQNDPALMAVLNAADLAIPDGMSIVKASAYIGEPLKERVTGVDFSYEAMKYMAESGKGQSVFFLGAKPGVAELAAEKLCEKLPGLKVAGVHDGYFKSSEEADLIKTINASGADFLLAALGSPKQEMFLASHKDELSVRVCIGVGGSFDVWSETVERAPEFWQRHNIEWLYRLIKEPSRIKRMAVIPKFLIKAKREASR